MAESRNFGSPSRKKFKNIQYFYENGFFTSSNATKLDKETFKYHMTVF